MKDDSVAKNVPPSNVVREPTSINQFIIKFPPKLVNFILSLDFNVPDTIG